MLINDFLLSDENPSVELDDRQLQRGVHCTDLVSRHSKRSFCFTKSYGKYFEGTGSLLCTSSGRIRYFSPKEIANLHYFPSQYQFPDPITVRQSYALLGNSLNVFVVAVLLENLIERVWQFRLDVCFLSDMNSRTLKRIANTRLKARSELKPEEWQRYNYVDDTSLISCRNDQIERIDARNVTREEFIEKYERPAKPVIIQHLIDDWPAMEKWSIEKVARKYRNQRFKVGEDDDGRSVKMKMKYFLDYAQNNRDDSPLYLFESSFGEHAKKRRLLDDYDIPEYFNEDLFHLVGEHRRPPHRWWCIGPQRSGTGIHVSGNDWRTARLLSSIRPINQVNLSLTETDLFQIDPLGTSAWNALISGHKRWCIFPPSTPAELLKPSSADAPQSKHEGITWFKVIYPRTQSSSWPKEYACIEAVQHPGEVIFVPGKLVDETHVEWVRRGRKETHEQQKTQLLRAVLPRRMRLEMIRLACQNNIQWRRGNDSLSPHRWREDWQTSSRDSPWEK